MGAAFHPEVCYISKYLVYGGELARSHLGIEVGVGSFFLDRGTGSMEERLLVASCQDLQGRINV